MAETDLLKLAGQFADARGTDLLASRVWPDGETITIVLRSGQKLVMTRAAFLAFFAERVERVERPSGEKSREERKRKE